MATTIKDIAEKAGVSISTVSLILNNKGRVAHSTRQQVETIIRDLNYRPLHSARKLATQMTGNVGYIIWEEYFSEVEMFYSQVFLGMECAARVNDYYILLTTVKEKFNPKTDLPRFLKYNDVDGVVLVGRVPMTLIEYLDHQKIPFVLIDYEVPGKNYNYIKIDNYNGAFRAVENLVLSGRKNIAFVGGSYFHPSIKERYRGYREALEIHNFEISRIEKYSYRKNIETSRSVGEAGAAYLLEAYPEIDAIFACTDHTALGVIEGIQKLNRKIPDEIAIIGFDDISLAMYNKPKLSTLSVPKMEIGKAAFKLLNELINNPGMAPQTRVLSVDLIIRESSLSNGDGNRP